MTIAGIGKANQHKPSGGMLMFTVGMHRYEAVFDPGYAENILLLHQYEEVNPDNYMVYAIDDFDMSNIVHVSEKNRRNPDPNPNAIILDHNHHNIPPHRLIRMPQPELADMVIGLLGKMALEKIDAKIGLHT